MPRPIKRLRWWIGGLLFLSTVINYIDRQTLSMLAPFLKVEYAWSNTDYMWLIIAFRLAYSVGQSIAGRALDRLGTRVGLSLAVVWYSLAAWLTAGFAGGRNSFAGFRFLSGLGEAGNWPGATKAVSEWFPKKETGWAVALFDSGSSIGGAVAGHQVEKATNTKVVGYRVQVQLDNGETRTFEPTQLDGLKVGDRVRIEQGQLRRV